MHLFIICNDKYLHLYLNDKYLLLKSKGFNSDLNMVVTVSERITKGRLFHENEIEIHQDRILMLCCLYLVARLRRKESEERILKIIRKGLFSI